MTDLFAPALQLRMSATVTFDGLCRETLTRVWDDSLPLAAWLATNPSVAGAEVRDPTDKRFEHFSRAVGAGGYVAVNMKSWRATDPSDMIAAVKGGRYTYAMHMANLAAIEAAAISAAFHFVAFGPAIARRWPDHVAVALDRFRRPSARLLCLRASDDGWPLHPLARGKHAIPNATVPQPWDATPAAPSANPETKL